jgi:hypothetical protein
MRHDNNMVSLGHNTYVSGWVPAGNNVSRIRPGRGRYYTYTLTRRYKTCGYPCPQLGLPALTYADLM